MIEITTDNLIIKIIHQNNAVELNNVIIDSFQELSKWLPWAKQIPSRRDTEAFCLHGYNSYLSKKEYIFVLIHRQTSYIVGVVSILNIDHISNTCEIGYWGKTSTLGKGLITEGVRSIIKYTFVKLKLQQIILTTDTKNIKSINLATRVGFKLCQIIPNERLNNNDQLRDTALFKLTNDEFLYPQNI